MLIRLGRALYWVGCGLAAINVILGLMFVLGPFRYHGPEMVQSGDQWLLFAMVAASAVIPWGIGRACRYVFAGE
jgi:hypothetical protein